MTEYLKSWIPKIKNFSLTLDKLAKLYNQPWVLVNEFDDFIKIIFQENGKLMVSKNGIVSSGNWELVSLANSILLDINGEKRLYNHQFIDDGLMILKLDGFSTDYFVLANQNVIPNLDIQEYLTNKYSDTILNVKEHNSKIKVKPATDSKQSKSNEYKREFHLDDGRRIQVIIYNGYNSKPEIRIDNKTPIDGYYKISETDIVYEVKDGVAVMEYYSEYYKQEDGSILQILGNRINGICKGSPVWIDNKPAPDGVYKCGWISKVKVENGKKV